MKIHALFVRYTQKQMHRFLFISFDVMSLSSVGSSGLLRAVEPLVAGVVSTASTSVDLKERYCGVADAAWHKTKTHLFGTNVGDTCDVLSSSSI